jgi:hypothetical protein
LGTSFHRYTRHWRFCFLVALPLVWDLLLCAKHLFVAAMVWMLGHACSSRMGCRGIAATPRVPNLLVCAKHLFVVATRQCPSRGLKDEQWHLFNLPGGRSTRPPGHRARLRGKRHTSTRVLLRLDFRFVSAAMWICMDAPATSRWPAKWRRQHYCAVAAELIFAIITKSELLSCW